MFKINKLTLYNFNGNPYTYEFKSGLNYFKGKNSSGKTEFYKFIDYMFGESEDIRKKPWFKNTLKKAAMEIQINNIIYILERSADPNQNSLFYANEEKRDIIDLKEYKRKINSIFARNQEELKHIREFTEEELTYRTFTMFNFLGEKRQGSIQNFFDKCSDIKYSIKLMPILNFIFNNNLEKIYFLQQKIKELKMELKQLQITSSRYEFICKQVNENILKLGFNVWYTGSNGDEIKNIINDLEVMYNNITEQIKLYENSISDAKQLKKDNLGRKKLLENLEQLLHKNNNLSYLIEPLKQLLNDIDETISFNEYIIEDKTIAELKKQKQLLKMEMQRNNSRFQCYTMEEKTKAIALIEEYLSTDSHDCTQELKNIKNEIRNKKNELKALQNSDDLNKIEEFSQFVTILYKSATGISSIVDDDILQNGFKIQYYKQGNILQPMIKIEEKDKYNIEHFKEVNYYIGSMARHTLIQLCGYLGFLKILLNENKYPIIPILVIDHISKPFDQNNVRAIGHVINKAYEEIGKENLQIFMFDDEEYTSLALNPEHSENLVNGEKSGFNPFYKCI